ncbi:MAG: AAA family ATPase [Deltaproteobacteria bacterium]|nr:AAA family ATPase [Deltaproteobacteria bacterium]
MEDLVARGPVPLRDATRLALDLLAACEERWTAWEAPGALDPAGVFVAEDASPGERRVSLAGSAAAEAPEPVRGAAPAGVQAVARVFAAMLAANGVSGSGRRDGSTATLEGSDAVALPAAARPLIACATMEGTPRPLRTWSALREALWNVLHVTEEGAALRAGSEARPLVGCLPGGAMPAGVVRRVQLGVRGRGGIRDAAWCAVRLPGGAAGQVVLTVDPEDGGTAHHARTFRCLWPGAELAAHGLPPPDASSTADTVVFALRAETVLVLEPLRLFEVTAVAAVHDTGCPLHFLAQLAEGTGTLGGPLLLGRLADAALRGLLERPGRPDTAIAGDALRAVRADEAWLRGEAAMERVEGSLRSLVPRLRAWLERRGAGPEAMNEVSRLSVRFGLSGRSDLVLPRGGEAPAIGELKSGSARRYDAGPADAGIAALRGAHAAQARMYGLLWSDAWMAAQGPEAPAPPKPVAVELFYAGSDDAYRLGPAAAELSRILASRNAMLDAFRRAAEGEPLPAAPVMAACDRCFQRGSCPRPGGDGRRTRGDGGAGDGETYARHFRRLLLRSVWHAQGVRREQLEPSARPARLAALTAEEGLELRLDGRAPRAASLVGAIRGALRPEEERPVLAHRGDPGALESFEAHIERAEGLAYRLRLSWPRPPWLVDGPGWTVEESRGFDNEREGFEGLARLAHRCDETLVAALAGARPVEPVAEAAGGALPAPPGGGAWHESQVEALRRGLWGGAIEPIQGPPGTGKTVFVGALVAALVAAGRRVVVGALTHNAADQAARRILGAGVRDLLRIGARSGSLLHAAAVAAGVDPALVFFEEFARKARGAAEARRRLLAAPVVVATCNRLGRLPFRGEFAAGGAPPFDVAVLDEATQVQEPAALAALALARRAVLVGDPRQLSCVEPAEAEWPPEAPVDARWREAGLGSLAQSLHERLCGLGFSTMLRRQHRMHERIMALPNRAFYGGALEAAPEAKARLLELEPARAGALPGWLATAIRPDEPLVLVDVPGGSDDRLNEREARLVAETAAALRRAGLDGARMGVVTPYRAQVALIRRTFAADEALRDVPVDTVERFQGDERDAILVSLVGGRPTGHLAHPNRINVTLTRARSKLIVFGDADGLSRDPLLGELVRQEETTRVAAP